jgi:hypothetical protein
VLSYGFLGISVFNSTTSCRYRIGSCYIFGSCMPGASLARLIFPTMLYRLLKNVYHSSSTVLCLSSRSDHSGTQSSAFRLDVARAREGSLPEKTVEVERDGVSSEMGLAVRERETMGGLLW